jgi:hypothetical protein
VELESVKIACANAQLECNAADERAKLLASEVIGLEEKVINFLFILGSSSSCSLVFFKMTVPIFPHLFILGEQYVIEMEYVNVGMQLKFHSDVIDDNIVSIAFNPLFFVLCASYSWLTHNFVTLVSVYQVIISLSKIVLYGGTKIKFL